METRRQRRQMVAFKAVATLIAIGLSLYVIWYEFGNRVFLNLNLLLILMLWGFIGVAFFIGQWKEAGEKPIREKLDELIHEIKCDRTQRREEWLWLKEYLGGEDEEGGRD